MGRALETIRSDLRRCIALVLRFLLQSFYGWEFFGIDCKDLKVLENWEGLGA